MPIPKPRKGESKNEFISRFMGDETMLKDYKDEKQRVAIAYSQWKKYKSLSISLEETPDYHSIMCDLIYKE